jgi:hypothetical protein
MQDSSQLIEQTVIPINVTTANQIQESIAVSPSGRNFLYFNGSHLLIFEVAAQTFDWKMTVVNESILSYVSHIRTKMAMSNTKISFVFNDTLQYSYNYVTGSTTIRSLPSAWVVNAIDTHDDYWAYASNKAILIEDPEGNLKAFNFSSIEYIKGVTILPRKLRIASERIDVALISGRIILGTLSASSQYFEEYNMVPSKSLGLEYQEFATQAIVTNFAAGYEVLVFQLRDYYNSVALAIPSSPGNHSCSMYRGERLGTYWCGNGGVTPTYPCPAGTYQPSFGLQRCLLCPDGTFQPHEGSVNCLPCKNEEYCPLGTIKPEIIAQNSSSQVTWPFPISESTTSFEEILLLLMFASSFSSNASISVALLGCVIITAVLLMSLLIKYRFGINLHQWLAKIDIHKKTKYKVKSKANGSFKIEPLKLESVFGGYLTLLAAFILLVGLITTIAYVVDYRPLIVGQDKYVDPSQNSVRAAYVQDYNTQSKASELANIIKDDLAINIRVRMYNYQSFLFKHEKPVLGQAIVKNCYDQYGNDCQVDLADFTHNDVAGFNITLKGPVHLSDMQVAVAMAPDCYFTFATIEIESLFGAENNDSAEYKTSVAKYFVLPGTNKVLTASLLIPITMTIVVRETEISEEEFDRSAYISFVTDETRLKNLGHSAAVWDTSNEPISFQFMVQLDNNWRLESEQRRVIGI